MKADPLTLPLIATSAAFFFLWEAMAVGIVFGGALGQPIVLAVLSLISLTGWLLCLRVIKGESSRWFFGIPLAVLFLLQVVQDSAAALSGIHPGQLNSVLLMLLAPAAALAMYAFPERCCRATRGPLAVTALISIASLYLLYLLLVRLTADPAVPVISSGEFEVVGILYIAYLMPIVGILLLWLGVRCQ